jgi:hypothetical protein
MHFVDHAQLLASIGRVHGIVCPRRTGVRHSSAGPVPALTGGAIGWGREVLEGRASCSGTSGQLGVIHRVVYLLEVRDHDEAMAERDETLTR